MAAADAFSDRAFAIVADNKLRAAIEAGEFDNLPGFGKPSPLIDEPYDPYWWVRSKLAPSNSLPIPPTAGRSGSRNRPFLPRCVRGTAVAPRIVAVAL